MGFHGYGACSCTDLLVRQSEMYINRAALGCVSMTMLHVQVGLARQQSCCSMCFHGYAACTLGLSCQQSSSGMCFHGYAACTVRTDSPTDLLWDIFPRLRCMYISDCLTNRTAPEVFLFLFHGYTAYTVRTISPKEQLWNEQFGLSHQQSSSGMGFHGYAP